MRQFRNLVCLVALTLVVSGCSIFNWFGDDEEETRVPNDLQAISEEIQLDRLWSVNVGRGAEDKAIKLVPGLSGSRVFAAAADGSVKAMDSGSGREIWKINIESLYTKQERKIAFSDSTDTITGGVGVGEDLVLVGSAAGEVVALNQSDGTLAWKSRTTSEVLAPPQATGQMVVAQTIDGKVAGFDALDGERRWLYSTSVPSLTLRGTSTPIIGDLVVVGFANGRISALDKSRGLAVVDRRIAAAKGKSDLERLVDIDGLMVLEGTQLYAASYQGNLVALDLSQRGRIRWAQEASSAVGLGSGFGNVYLAGEDSGLEAIDGDNGREVWQTDALLYRDITTPVAVGSYVAVGDFEGYLHLIAQSDGRFVGRRVIDKKGINSPAVVDGRRIYIMGNSGRLSALEIR
ncbi:MAG: outer membrane protein assembly factor BamB [Pseudomonadales bacterium]|jgi:outer membrane protein assembly factor BamB|nr:outer membrane protein assembly factor BamB [Gammaproteobacteria bacterium]MDP6267401.1 outer membrane protein assembly factor BamB [Arenicellales bacterium]MDP7452229.1 outer membrane protein assembly factor BamB [Arenicellales bacterium]MDP7576360.1 outer membrane protein assembly factor BamB [Pseudomonadales bacterium]HJP52164.1 outer membrane protein assembly factor BamB [Pseudomonadales bacterium]|tara:strand:+ start:756 stop:1967 length:1212 start_codon:yes stop_codon:yes gene_type:complete